MKIKLRSYEKNQVRCFTEERGAYTEKKYKQLHIERYVFDTFWLNFHQKYVFTSLRLQNYSFHVIPFFCTYHKQLCSRSIWLTLHFFTFSSLQHQNWLLLFYLFKIFSADMNSNLLPHLLLITITFIFFYFFL